MPTVPTYNVPNIAPTGLGGGDYQPVSQSVFSNAEQQGRQTEQAGADAVSNAINDMHAMAREQSVANQLRVDDALNKVRAAQQQLTYDPAQGYLSQKGKAAIEPNDQGQGLQDTYGVKLQDAINQASDGLANAAQRQLFDQHAKGIQTQFSGQIQSHVLSEYKQFGIDTQKGTIALAMDAAVKSWQNPDQIDQNIASIKAATWKSGQLMGEPANMIEAMTQQNVSKVHAEVIQEAIKQNNPGYAQAYLAKYKDGMTAGDLLKVQAGINQDLLGRSATSAAQNVMKSYSASFSPTDMDRVIHITAMTESGKQDFKADGSPVISSEGAKYGMQVMPATAKNPGHGIAPAQSDTPQEYNRVGQELMAALVKKYAGSPDTLAKAWAAYNAGDANVDKAIKDAGETGNWMDALAKFQSPENHEQTLNYVNKNVKQFNNGTGAPPLPSLLTLHDQVRKQLGPNAPSQVVERAEAEVTRQYKDVLDARQQQANDTVKSAQQYLIQTKGDLNAMPIDMKQAIIAQAPDKWNDLQTFANHVANPVKDDNMSAYHTAIENPKELASMDDATFNQFVMTNFKPETQKSISKLRQDVINGTDDASPSGINMSAVNRNLENRLTNIGIMKPTPTSSEGDKQRYGTIEKYMIDAIYEEQRQRGHKLKDEEITKFIDQQFLRQATTPSFWSFMGASPNKVDVMSMKADDIPEQDLTKIKNALAKQGNTSPTNDQILRTYWSGKRG